MGFNQFEVIDRVMKNVSHRGLKGTNFTPPKKIVLTTHLLSHIIFFVFTNHLLLYIFASLPVAERERSWTTGGRLRLRLCSNISYCSKTRLYLTQQALVKKTEHICDGDKNYCFSFCRISSSKPSQCSIWSFHFHPVIIDSP